MLNVGYNLECSWEIKGMQLTNWNSRGLTEWLTSSMYILAETKSPRKFSYNFNQLEYSPSGFLDPIQAVLSTQLHKTLTWKLLSTQSQSQPPRRSPKTQSLSGFISRALKF